MSRFSLFAALLCLGIMWGTTIPLTKIAVSTGHHPFGLIFWQFLISAVILLFVMAWRRSRFIIDRAHLLFFLVIATIGTLIPNSVTFTVATHIPGGVMALIIALVPVFALVIALILRRETFNPIRFGGIFLGFIAMALIILPDSSLPDPSKAIFVLLGMVSPFCYGLEGNYLSLKQPKDTGPIATLFGASVIGTALSGILVLATGTFINPANGIGAPELAQIASTILHIFAYTGYIWMVGAAGAVFAAQVGYIVTPAGVLISMFVLDENHSRYIWLALAILLIALTLVNPRERSERAS